MTMNYGKVSVSKTSQYIEQTGGQKISPFLQEKLIYIGQGMCYENGAEAVRLLLGIQTNDTAIYRLTDQMGKALEQEIEAGQYHRIEQVDEQERVYCQVDGSQLLSREDGWRETKLGRVFKSGSLYSESGDRQWIRSSEYVAHLGGHKEFENKMSPLLDHYEGLSDRLVFINDGAVWIQNWIEAEYPKAIQILDFYHGMTHLSDYAKLCIKDVKSRQEWLSKTAEVMQEKGYEPMLKRVNALECNTKTKKEEKKKLLNYLDRNKKRMDYPKFLERGLLIGSGAIESAHRTVLQDRLKKAGQRWSIEGLKNIIRLRVLNKSDHWDLITNKLRKAA